jgi:hypothetical protein
MKLPISLTSILVIAVVLLTRCFNSGKTDPRGPTYAGSASCRRCHPSIAGSYTHTAHFHSAAIAAAHTIEGSFLKDSNTFFVNDTMKVAMEMRGGVPWQVFYNKDKEERAERFDVVFGFAKGQAYLYWKNDRIYQLPISWFNSLHRWTSSPGYPSGKPFFDRPVLQRCFECHTSFVTASTEHSPSAEHSPSEEQNTTPSASRNFDALDKRSLILEIDCERCHGPAAAHVAYHTENPGEKKGQFIIAYKNLSRARRIDGCAICHSGGNSIELRSAFAFRPGDSLLHFVVPAPMNPVRADVHGDQVGLLASSKCFQMSRMECTTCHNPHLNDHGDVAAYSRRCQTCHSVASHNLCKLTGRVNTAYLQTNCTTCHMPTQASDIIKVRTAEANANTAIYMVNHRIAVYPEVSAKALQAAGIKDASAKALQAAGIKDAAAPAY